LLANNVTDTALIGADGDLTKFAKVGVRAVGHDLLDGRFDGDVVMRTITNPAGSGNADLVANIDMIKKWGQLDLQDNGKVDGSALASLVERIWPNTDFRAIPGQLTTGPSFNDASMDRAEWNRNLDSVVDFTNPRDPKVNLPVLNATAAQLGVSSFDLLDATIWGHRVLDLQGTQQQAVAHQDALIDAVLSGQPNNTFDAIFARDVPGYADHLRQQKGSLEGLGLNFLNVINVSKAAA
jgi:hypothetical protein